MAAINHSSSYGTPDFFKGGAANGNSYPNPFYGVPLQYLPSSVDAMIWWADHLLLRNGFYRAALERIVNYFITNLVIEHDDKELQDKYKDIFDKIRWKEILKTSGLNTLAYGNDFLTVAQGFERFVTCPECGNSVNLDKINKYSFNKGKYSMKCPTPTCNYNGVFKLDDQPSKDYDKVIVVHWPVRQVLTRHDRVSGATEYHWQMPQEYIKQVSKKDNKFSSKKTPKYIFDAVFAQGGPKLIELNPKNLLHLKMPHPSSIETNGKAIPMCMFMFDDFFMHQTLKRFNEVICFEDINPFRVFSMVSDNSPQASPVFNQSGALWKTAVDELIVNHRRDPGSYQSFPFPVNFQRLGGEGKELAPVELLNQSQANILGALNIPQELFNMNLQVNTIGPALRLFENTWTVIPESFDRVVQHIADVCSKIYKLDKVKASLMKVTIADDMERKSVISQLVSANAIARSELLNIYNLDYKDQLQKKQQEQKDEQEVQQKAQEEAQLEAASSANVFSQQQGGQPGQPLNNYSTAGSTPGDVQAQAQQIAQKLYPMDGAARRQELQSIKGTNETLWAAVKGALDQMTSSAKSQGVQATKQQAAQGQ